MNTQVGTPASPAKLRITTSTSPAPSSEQMPNTSIAKMAIGIGFSQ